jgi:hypothetical protein
LNNHKMKTVHEKITSVSQNNNNKILTKVEFTISSL